MKVVSLLQLLSENMLEFIIRLPTIQVASVHSERVTSILDYSAHLQPEVEDALCQNEYFLIQLVVV